MQCIRKVHSTFYHVRRQWAYRTPRASHTTLGQLHVWYYWYNDVRNCPGPMAKTVHSGSDNCTLLCTCSILFGIERKKEKDRGKVHLAVVCCLKRKAKAGLSLYHTGSNLIPHHERLQAELRPRLETSCSVLHYGQW